MKKVYYMHAWNVMMKPLTVCNLIYDNKYLRLKGGYYNRYHWNSEDD
jgi:hypothetical protein